MFAVSFVPFLRYQPVEFQSISQPNECRQSRCSSYTSDVFSIDSSLFYLSAYGLRCLLVP